MLYITRGITFILLLLLSGCAAHVVYTPNAQHVPLQKKKDDLHAAVNFRNLQTAYAFSDHFSVMANGFYRAYRQKKKEYIAYLLPFIPLNEREESGSHVLGELGAGYHITRGITTAEIYAGYGLGYTFLGRKSLNATASNYGLTDTYSAHYRRVFVQPDIGWTFKKTVIGLSARLSEVDFHRVNTTYDMRDLQLLQLDKIGTYRYFFVEPSIILKNTIHPFKLQTQFVYMKELSNKNYTSLGDTLWFKDFLLNISLTADISGEKLLAKRSKMFSRLRRNKTSPLSTF